MDTDRAPEDDWTAASRATRWTRALALGLLAVPATLAFRPAAKLVDMPLTEDGLLALRIARNVAEGRGLTWDGVEPTNGFQPLWVGIASGACALGNALGVDPLRIVLLLHAVVFAATGLLLARTVAGGRPSRGGDPVRFWCTAFLWAAAPLAIEHAFNGLETGVSLFALLAVWTFLRGADLRSVRGAAGAGLLLGAAVLARIDAVLLVASFAGALLVTPALAPLAVRVRAAAVAVAVAGCVSAPWWAWNVSLTGSPVPVSGTSQATAGISADRLASMARALVKDAVPWVHAGATTYVLTCALCATLVVAFLAVAIRRRAASPRPAPPPPQEVVARRTAAAFLASLTVVYAACFHATWFYPRYLAPLLLVGVGVGGMLLAAALRRTSASSRLAQAAPAILAAAAVPAVVRIASFHHHPLRGGVASEYLFDLVPLVERHVPPGDLVGTRQSGTLGYLRSGVVNLDGKVSPAALRRQGDLLAYLDERGVRWVCDWEFDCRATFGGDPPPTWELAAQGGAWQLFRRRP